MTFPVVESTAEYGGAWQSIQDHTFTLPTGIQSGDIILVLVTTNNTATVTIAGFTEFDHHKFFRVADGSEGATVEVVKDLTHRASIVGYRISGADVAEAVEGGEAMSSSSPQVTASWGSRDNLFVAVLQTSAGDQTVDPPTSYGGLLTSGDSHPATSRNRIWSAHRTLAAASDTPGAWTVTSGSLDSERAYTIVVAGPDDGPGDPPAAPGNLAAATAPAIDVSWDAVVGADSYDLERDSTIIETGLTVTEYLDTNVVFDTEYSYRIRTDEGGVKSDWTVVVSHTPTQTEVQTEFVWDGTQWV